MISFNRSDLKFKEEVIKAFNWLEVGYGFRCIQAEETFVQYESDKIYINIYHGRSSYEIGLEFDLVEVFRDYPYSLSALLDITDVKEEKDYKNYCAWKQDTVIKGVFRLSKLFKTYCIQIINGDVAVFAKLKELEEQAGEDFAKKVLYDQTKPKADEAFRCKDYKKALKFYEEIENSLSAVDKKKLEYVKKHVSE